MNRPLRLQNVMITRCPSCRTAFKVVPDQLRIAAGWVRCGHCGELFDGRSHLVDATPESAPPARDDVPLAFRDQERPVGNGSPISPREIGPDAREPDTEADFQPTLAMGPEDQSLVERLEAERQQALQREAEQRAEAERQAAERARAEEEKVERMEAERERDARLEADRLAETQSEEIERQAVEMPAPAATSDVFPRSPAEADGPLADGFTVDAPAAPSEGHDEPRFRFDRPVPDEPLGLLAASPITLDTAPAVPPPPNEPALAPDPFMGPRRPVIDSEPSAGRDAIPSFVHAPKVHRFWDSAGVRALLWTALPILVVALAAQWVLHERDWLAARTPALAPLLDTLCAPFGCAVQPYRLLNAIAIDGSDFKAIDADTFRFDLSVRNGADVAVAMPAFQLTLSDLQGQVLVRRVIQAGELGAPASLKAHGEFDATRALHIAGVAHPEAITSYRVVAFYP